MTHYSKHLLRQRFVLLLTQLSRAVHLFSIELHQYDPIGTA